jgi:D-glycero-alpha-D-manno-heptose-7-phosphate kinase
MIITKTPYRISFFGGGTDLNQWFKENGGAVISTTIDKYCYITCRFLPKFFNHNYRFVYSKVEEVCSIKDIEHPAIRGILNNMHWNKGIEVHHDGDLPARSGLGSSSSFTVGFLNTLAAMQGRLSNKYDLARDAIHIEQNILKENVGCQDQIAAAFGGFNKIQFYGENSFDISPIIVRPERLDFLQKNLLLFFTGISRFASDIEKSKLSNLSSKKVELKKIHEMVDISIEILQNENKSVDEFGLLLNETWKYKKSLSVQVSNDFIDYIYKKAINSGALGGKILGAGGGGFILFYAPINKHEDIKAALSELIHIPFQFENNGSSVVLYNPNGL